MQKNMLTRMREFIQRRARKDSEALMTGLLVLLGAYTAFKLLMLLSPGKMQGGDSTGKTDSARNVPANVQTVNRPDSAGTQPGTGGNGGAYNGLVNVDSNFNLSTVTKTPIDVDRYNKAAAGAGSSLNIFEWLIVPLLALVIGIRMSLYFAKQPKPNMKLDTDTDPEELTEAFRLYSAKIETLGNPRKIKRFSNKVRFQYHYLKNQKALKEDNDLAELVQTLLYIEGHMSQMNMERLSPTEQREPIGWFRSMLKRECNIDIDESLAKHLLQLNKNVIA